ncbi:unnamed protein product [Mytilus edulis]|uniref:Uncharacterized protein n=1 Tax=Mytilus edulis TaxID=6550 RepID=A0A8S3TSB0_MYTED|nr:unnamed protein product [Mytilus edulis]
MLNRAEICEHLLNRLEICKHLLNRAEICEHLLNKAEIYVYAVLSSVLIKAYETKDNTIQVLVFTRIVQESPKIVSQFRELYSDIVADANVWIGVECTCDKAFKNQYESVPCRKADLTFVIEKNILDTSDSKFPKRFLGFQTLYVDTRSSRGDEAATISEEMMKCLEKTLEKTPNKVPGTLAKKMFKRHSNLTMVCPSVFKSKGFMSGSANLQAINCVQLFCKKKGMIPIGEFHFPLALDGTPTDVLEGTSQFLSAVHIGDKIYNKKGQTGTLGGFVQYYGIDTFLTCSHVIFGKNLLKLQNKDIHCKCHRISNKDELEPVECVLIRHSLKYDTQEKPMEVEGENNKPAVLQANPEETSIDAALFLVQTPENCLSSVPRDVLTRRSASATAGTSSCNTNIVELKIKLHGGIDSNKTCFSEYGLDLKYLNKNVLDPANISFRALALSAQSEKQENYVTLHREQEVIVPIPAHVRTRNNIILYNQFVIRNMQFTEGDSGTCIYGKCMTSGHEGCIGMLIGASTSGQYIVTPMKDILNALGVNNMP